MFDDLDETIRQLLIAEMPINSQGEVDIEFDLPRRENTANWVKPAIINFFLYDVRENNILRQHGWERLPDGNGGNHQARLKRTPLRMDCSYMITTWAKFPVDQHRLLARCLLTLTRFPVLPPEYLVGSLQNPPFDIQARVASHDRLTNPAEMWSALDNEIHPSLSYVVTLTMNVEDVVKELETPLVLTSQLRLEQGINRKGPVDDAWQIAGVVRDSEGNPLKGARLTLLERSIQVTSGSTDKKAGRYTFIGLQTGSYTIRVQANGLPEWQQTLNVPQTSYDLQPSVNSCHEDKVST